jgi:hypothetical protein
MELGVERVLRFESSLLSEKTSFTQCNVVSSCSIGGLFETEHGSEPLQQSFPLLPDLDPD